MERSGKDVAALSHYPLTFSPKQMLAIRRSNQNGLSPSSPTYDKLPFHAWSMGVATKMMEYTEWHVLWVLTFLVSIRPEHYPRGGPCQDPVTLP